VHRHGEAAARLHARGVDIHLVSMERSIRRSPRCCPNTDRLACGSAEDRPSDTLLAAGQVAVEAARARKRGQPSAALRYRGWGEEDAAILSTACSARAVGAMSRACDPSPSSRLTCAAPRTPPVLLRSPGVDEPSLSELSLRMTKRFETSTPESPLPSSTNQSSWAKLPWARAKDPLREPQEHLC